MKTARKVLRSEINGWMTKRVYSYGSHMNESTLIEYGHYLEMNRKSLEKWGILEEARSIIAD
jgi:hypothetical protein